MATLCSARQDKPPPGFATIQDVIDGKHREGSKVNISGVLTDFRAPIATRGKDWKCQMRIYDQSVQDEPDVSILLNIFRPEKEMPDAKCGDVIMVFAAKVQYYHYSYSLFTHKSTNIFVFDAAKIPKSFTDASRAMRPATCCENYRRPNKAESVFVSVLHGTINKERLPDASEFETMKMNSTNVKMKFSELKDVREGKFVDTVAEIVKEPYDLGDKITLWISDYTENPFFNHHQLLGSKAHQVGSYGDINKRGTNVSKSDWAGPFGKLSMQVTCFEPHASIIRDEKFAEGTWVFLRNLQIKYGHSMANLEGFLREDRGAQGTKLNISKESTLDPETTRLEVKNALRRKRQYEKARKAQLWEITEAAAAGVKRTTGLSSDGQPPPKMNSRMRRNLKRAKRGQAHKEQEGQVSATMPKDHVPDEVHLDLNTYVKCENGSKPATSIADILTTAEHEVNVNGEIVRLPLPFINANYRTHVRVVDFIPPLLEDFAQPRKVSSEYAALSDHGDTDLDLASESSDSSNVVTRWEWRFALRLEDARPSDDKSKQSLWAIVDNQSAQMLLNLDASNLRNDDETLGLLRQRMFTLWGDLEEYKARLENRGLKSKPFGNNGPPTDSDGSDGEAPTQQIKAQSFSNRPFECCIRQYGVKTNIGSSQTRSTDGELRWQRMFGLFGTRLFIN